MERILIDRSNYEEYVLEYLDHSLTNDYKNAFEDFLDQNPKLKDEINQFEYIKIPKDASVLYEHKEKLIKSETGPRFFMYSKYLMLLLFTITLALVTYYFNTQEKQDPLNNQSIQNMLVEKHTEVTPLQKADKAIMNKATADIQSKSIKNEERSETKEREVITGKKELVNKKEKAVLAQSKTATQESTISTKVLSKKKTNNNTTKKKSDIIKSNNTNIYASQDVEKIEVTKKSSNDESILATTAVNQKENKNEKPIASLSVQTNDIPDFEDKLDTSSMAKITPIDHLDLNKREQLTIPQIELIIPTQIKSNLNYDDYYAIKEDELYDRLSFVYKEDKPSKQRFIGKLIFANISIALLPTYLQKN